MTYFSEDPAAIDAATRERTETEPEQDAAPAARDAPFKRTPATMAPALEMKTRKVPSTRVPEEGTGEADADFASPALMETPNRERESEARAASPEHCDAEARQGADTWYSCVLALREQGLDDAARAEFDALLETFPDFREPVP